VTARRAGAVAGLLAVVLLAGCGGGDHEPEPDAPSTSAAPSSARTPPPISPRTTVSFSPAPTLPSTLAPPSGSGEPIPIPSAPED
jgi:hypothetical protein